MKVNTTETTGRGLAGTLQATRSTHPAGRIVQARYQQWHSPAMLLAPDAPAFPTRDRVTISLRARQLLNTIHTVSRGFRERLQSIYADVVRLYNARGTFAPLLWEAQTPAGDADPATTSPWQRAYRVSLSGASRLVQGVLQHVDATPSAQRNFIAGIRAATEAGYVSQSTIDQARAILEQHNATT